MRKIWSTRMAAVLLALVLEAESARAQEASEEPGARAIPVPSWFKLSFLDIPEDIQEAADAGKRLMMYFHQDGCPYCKALIEVNFSLKDIVEKTQRYFDAIEINIWGDREVVWTDGKTRTEKEFARFLNIQYTPTLIFLDEAGKVVLRINGYYPPHKFTAALDYVGKKLEKTISFTRYLKESAEPPASGKFHDEPFFKKPPFDLRRKGLRKKPLAVFFEQRICSPCDELHTGPLRDELTRKLIGQFDAVQLNLHGKRPVITPDGRKTTEGQWAEDLNVAFAPSIVFFDEKGEEVFRTEAYLKTFHIQSVFDYVAKKAYKTQPNFQRFLQARADSLRELGIEVDLWK